MRFSRVPVVYLIYVLLCLAAYHHCRKMSSSEIEKAGSSLPSSPLANSSLDGTPVKRARSYGRFFSKKVDLFGDGSHDGADISDVSANDENDIANILQPTVSHEEVLSSSSDTDTSSSESDSSDDESDSSDEESDSSCFSSGSDSSFSDSDSADSEESSEYDIAEVQELFSGSEKTTDEAIVALMDLYINRRWKLSTLREVLKFCHAFFPSNLPKSDYKLFSYVESHAPENYQEICHYYCGDCLTLKKERNDHCDECDSTQTSVFFEFPLSVQIKHLFEQRNLAGLIDSYRSKIANDENICDITSGYAFRKLKTEVSRKYDLTLLFNSDGISPVNSSEAHLYPILATICEISPKLRSSHLIVCGIWYDLTFAPVMNDFFKPFVSELCKIEEEGITWTHPGTKQEFQSVVTAPVLSADALGRAEILVMQHHMGKHGCNSCEQKTKRFKPESGKKIRRYVYQEKPAKLRSKDRMDKQGRKAAEGLPVKGVVGNAVVSRIPHFNRGNSAPPEYMHCVLLGVVLQFLKLWFKTPGEWNIKGKMNDIDRFIVKSVKVTDQYGRVPKKIKNLRLWKASDLRAWLLFISLPALKGHLPDKYYQHYMLLVTAIHSLLKEKITPDDLLLAETKLRIFVRDIRTLYRLQDYTYNVHNLLHLVEHVRRWGPLWAVSAFVFENFNHILGDLAHGPKHKGKQIVNRIRRAIGLEVMRNKISKRLVRSTPQGTIRLTSPDVINPAFFAPSQDVDEVYLRADLNGVIFTTQKYDQKKKRANSYVQFETATRAVAYGRILCFYTENSVVKCLVKKFKVEHQMILSHIEGKFSILQLIPVSETDTVISITGKAIVTKLAKVGNYLCIRPNTIEKNL